MYEKKADYFISLIGANPLPCFYSALQYCDDNTIIYLVYTKKAAANIGTKILADNVKSKIKGKIGYDNVELIECDKSDPNEINKTINEILGKIYKNKNKKDPENIYVSNLVLDYTSGTKVMSALFYNRFSNIGNENIKVVRVYLEDDDTGTNSRFIKTSVDGYATFDFLRDTLENFDIDVEDVVEIHGYKLSEKYNSNKGKTASGSNVNSVWPDNQSNKLSFKSPNGNIVEIDATFLINGTLYVCFDSRYRGEKKSTYKMELFWLKDVAEKLGGSRSGMVYRCDCDDNTKEGLKDDLRRDYEFDIKKRLKILDIDTSFADFLSEKMQEN